MSKSAICPLLVLLLSIGFMGGCGSRDEPVASSEPAGEETAAEHADPHDIPLTAAEIEQLREETSSWSAAVERVQQYRDQIRKGATSNLSAEAHRPLDLLDNLLQWLPEIAQQNNVPKEHWEMIGTNSQKLRDLFNEVHANIDAGKAPGYEAVSDQIDKLVAELAAVQAEPGAN